MQPLNVVTYKDHDRRSLTAILTSMNFNILTYRSLLREVKLEVGYICLNQCMTYVVAKNMKTSLINSK